MKVLITGNAGFIGFHATKKFLSKGFDVVGVDSINNYYSTKLKKDRLNEISKFSKKFKTKYTFIKGDLASNNFVKKIFKKNKINIVIHLAAQAGVRYSLINPYAYLRSNLVAFTNILEACRQNRISHLVYASTSSIYGANTSLPFKETDSTNHPLQFYAATKKANEAMAHSYSNLFKLPTTGLRFFTVYGPWGRPDMALSLFTKNILAKKHINIFNNGNHTRDFTYVEDIVEGILRISKKPPKINNYWNAKRPDASSSKAPYRIFNIGNNKRIKLMKYIEEIEKNLNIKAKKKFLPLQAGDVPDTYADVTSLIKIIKYSPNTNIKLGIYNFINWYKEYYKV
ncbi:MAG: capsular biosynthesis protein CpsI [Candidatus Pelagibacter sp. TMED64]|nr:capsular biosynthesis protein CpsI [Candidatus Pelagibacter sp.]OUU66375.1 MAG: capsular biosynthesis protein CpsI [Candidatus Pelagibacter sp. TMED64]|tara:strand:+ start:787 stop:1809 length:1023 start_codon:yes stop_codon:yes gene_type:complete